MTQCRSPEQIPEDPDAPPSSEKPSKSASLQRLTYQHNLMGTRFFITLYSAEKKSATRAVKEAFHIANEINATCSDYDVTSELMRLNASPAHHPVPVSDLLFDVLQAALQISKETHGAYDPTLGHHSYNWRMARKKGVLPTDEQIAEAKSTSGWKHLTLNRENKSITKEIDGMRLDLGGIAKGYAAEKMLHILKDHHITQASITAGGEVRVGDPPPNQTGWKVILKTLDSNHQLIPKSLILSNCAVSTSGDLHQSITIGGQRYSHICDPASGLGLTTRISATVIGKSATITDALATALCVHPELHDKLTNVQTFVIFETKDGTLRGAETKKP